MCQHVRGWDDVSRNPHIHTQAAGIACGSPARVQNNFLTSYGILMAKGKAMSLKIENPHSGDGLE